MEDSPIELSRKTDEDLKTDTSAAQLLYQKLIEDHLNSYRGAEKIFAINSLFLLIQNTRNILFPELPKGDDFDGIEAAETDLQALLSEKSAAIPKTGEVAADKTEVAEFVEKTLVVNFLGPLAQSTFKNISLGASFENNDVETSVEPVNVDALAAALAEEVPDLNSIEDLTEDTIIKVNDKLDNLLTVSGLHLTKKMKRGTITLDQVINKIKTLEELRKKVPLQQGGSYSFLKLLATALLALTGAKTEPSSTGLVIHDRNETYATVEVDEPHEHHEGNLPVVVQNPASFRFNIGKEASTAAEAISRAKALELVESTPFKRMLTILEHRDEKKSAPRYDVTTLNEVYNTLKDLRALIHQNPAIINHLERILVEDVLITFTRYTNPPVIVSCADDGCIRTKIAEIIDDEDAGEIVEKQSEIKEIITNIASGNRTHVLTDVMLITKEQALGKWLASWAADFFGGHEVASSTKAAMLQRIVLTVEEKIEGGEPKKKTIIVLGNNLNSLKPLAAAYGPLKGNGFINTHIGGIFFDFIEHPGAQSLDFVTLASVNPARIASNASTSPHLLSIFEGFRGLNNVAIQLAFFNYANKMYEQAASIIDVGNKGLTIGSEVAIPDNVVAAAHKALVQIQEITSLTIGPSGTAFLGEVITAESAQKSITAFDTGLGNLTADNPLTIAVKEAKAGLVHVATQLKDVALKTADAGYQTGLTLATILLIMGKTIALIIPLLLSIIASSMKNNWYKPCMWYLAPAKALIEAGVVFGGATSLAMISYLAGLDDSYSGAVPILIYAVYSKSFIQFLINKLNGIDPMEAPAPAAPLTGLPAVATGLPVQPPLPPYVAPPPPPRYPRVEPGEEAQRAAYAAAVRAGRALPNARYLQTGRGYRISSKPNKRKTGKHKKSRKQKSKRVTRRRKTQK